MAAHMGYEWKGKRMWNWIATLNKRAFDRKKNAECLAANRLELACGSEHATWRIDGVDNWVQAADSVKFWGLKVTIAANGSHLRFGDKVEFAGAIELFGEKSRILIGNNCDMSNAFLMASSGKSIRIGDDCLFSDRVDIRTTDSHRIFDRHGETINPDADVEIGSRVWLGKGVTIMKGVTIGDDVVIGAQSVVTGDIPANCVAAGIPARVIREGTTWQR